MVFCHFHSMSICWFLVLCFDRDSVVIFEEERYGEDFEGAGQRYLYLLKPVKDLSKNFETDIAKELDDYCSSLREITSNEDLSVNNQHRFNFAEAAMLIQGSAFVFGRKVDFVHSQAIHFFEALQPQKAKKSKKSGEEVDEGFVDENEPSTDPCELIDYSSVKQCKVNSLHKIKAKSKYKGDPPKIRVMPMSLMPLADNEKSGVVVYSTGYRMEIIGKMDDFRMNSGFVCNRAALLLHLGHEKIIDDFASEAFMRLWNPHLFQPNGQTQSQPPPENNVVKDSQNHVADSGMGSSTDVAGSDPGRTSSAMEIDRRATATTLMTLTLLGQVLSLWSQLESKWRKELNL
ncbi:hypothetical protein KIN20_007075 [Parelaphostrongylus tenuis]|uniref:Condensin II complex subunit H2 N-terminal domain-containing protein n=1 Tax=Parelaphostrongylus tenuis TaxID=148309 RepID=A0AAD5M4R2_PARTN|nr:hypothetical protein KIN20_007075 [Parelaphostrongylus tenuis]